MLSSYYRLEPIMPLKLPYYAFEHCSKIKPKIMLKNINYAQNQQAFILVNLHQSTTSPDSGIKLESIMLLELAAY